MKTMQERINLIIAEMDGPDRGRQTRLAEIAGCSRGLVSQWMAGTNESMGYEYAKNIEVGLGYCTEWVINGTPPMRDQGATMQLKPQEAESPGMVDAEEIAKLISLYAQATKRGREVIMSSATGVEKISLKRRGRSTGN